MTQARIWTDRLVLEPLQDHHLEHEIALDSDTEVMRYLCGRTRTEEEVRGDHLTRLAKARVVEGLGLWAGFLRAETSQFVGLWMLEPVSQAAGLGEAEIGYRLHSRHWRQGLAAEGAKELMRYGFSGVGVQRIFGQTMAVNTASRATMESIGMQLVRHFHQHFDDPLPGSQNGEVEYDARRDGWLQHYAVGR